MTQLKEPHDVKSDNKHVKNTATAQQNLLFWKL